MEYIKLKKSKEILKLGIMDEDGNIVKDEKGNDVFIEFDLADVNLPLKYNRCVNTIENARRELKGQYIVIDKKQDHKKGEYFLSSNEIEKAKALKQFYKKMEEAMDMFLGENGTKKFLNGRNPYWEMFDDLAEAIEPFKEKMNLTFEDMTNRIKSKYKVNESDVLTSD